MTNTNFKINENRYDLIINLLKGIKNHLEQQEDLKRDVLDFKQACRYLNISDSLLYKISSSGEIASSKPRGGKLYFLKEDLDNWTMSKNSKSDEELSVLAKDFVRQNLNFNNLNLTA